MAARLCGNRLLEQLMSPSPKSQVMFASAFSRIGVFFRIFGIHTFYATATFYTSGAHALTTVALTSCARVRSLAIARRVHMASQMLGVSLRARHDTTQVMLGVSLRASWIISKTLLHASKSPEKLWLLVGACLVILDCGFLNV